MDKYHHSDKNLFEKEFFDTLTLNDMYKGYDGKVFKKESQFQTYLKEFMENEKYQHMMKRFSNI